VSQPTSRVLFDFECPECGNIFEELVYRNVFRAKCPECDSKAVRQVSAPRLDPRLGLDSSFPTAVDKWERTRREHHKKGKEHYGD